MTDEVRIWNGERHGYDVKGPCWNCAGPATWFEDEDGTPREVAPVITPEIIELAGKTLDRPARKSGERGFQYVCYCEACVAIRRAMG
jgi:hypothetical protein